MPLEAQGLSSFKVRWNISWHETLPTILSSAIYPSNSQIVAKLVYNCHVTAICSSKNVEYVQKLGSDDVIDYTSQDIVEVLLEKAVSQRPYDLIVDCVGGTDFFNAYIDLLNPKGAYVTIVGDKTGVKTLGGPPTYFTSPAQVVRFIKGYIWGPRYACM